MDTRQTARRIAEEAIVLLKNEEGVLPFSGKETVALIGRAQTETIYSGNGSGAAHTPDSKKILDECEKRGLCAEPHLKAFYQEKMAAEVKTEADTFDFTKIKDMVNSGIMYEIFGKYRPPVAEYEIPAEVMEQAKAAADTAVLVIGRNSGGEECDRHLYADYELTESERRMVEQTCAAFDQVVVVLNVNGLIDLGWTRDYPAIKSVLFIGIPGEEGAAALADILTGRVCPSGKLAFTVAQRYEDYPSAKHFTWEKDDPAQILTYAGYGLSAEENGSTGFAQSPVTVYQEDIYNGYRYFDTFKEQAAKPLYPFGYGLSYTDFTVEKTTVERTAKAVVIEAVVRNSGAVAGKEVLQVYLSAVGTKQERAYQELKDFRKTKVLQPGESEKLSLRIPWKELASYVEERAAYVIEAGEYLVRLGNSSRNTDVIYRIIVEEELVAEQVENRLGLKACNQGKLRFLTQGSREDAPYRSDQCGQDDRTTFFDAAIFNKKDAGGPDESVQANITEALSTEELAALCVGYGPGTPFSAITQSGDPETIFHEDGRPVTTNSHPAGFNGYVSPAIEEKGIRSVFYKDGPAGIGKIAWPTAMLMACAFDREVWYQFGDAVGSECEEAQVDVWLAPAVNLHRHPLCGRNFEYFSEDPVLTGICACAITDGVQKNHPVLVCAKHFAVNEQETFRRGSSRKKYDAVDSILTERAARELYLKPFEMLVREAGIACIMTSFNKINGTFAGGNKDLCTHILREEWGFTGVVVTDWGDMDVVVDGADAVAAGNDVVMPGGPPVIAQILQGYEEGRVSRKEMEEAVRHLLLMAGRVRR